MHPINATDTDCSTDSVALENSKADVACRVQLAAGESDSSTNNQRKPAGVVSRVSATYCKPGLDGMNKPAPLLPVGVLDFDFCALPPAKVTAASRTFTRGSASMTANLRRADLVRPHFLDGSGVDGRSVNAEEG